MKRLVLFTLLLTSISLAFSQEGINYLTTRKCLEKTYEINQKFGKNKMKLITLAKVEYDTTGYIIRKTMTKGNLNYAGKTLVNRTKQPNTWEVLNYNYMNLLQDRWVKITENDPREYTEIQYSPKGKIIYKTRVRVDSLLQHEWEMVYHELGYIPSYYEVESDSTGLVGKKIKYDYGDNPVESTVYFYNDQRSPVVAMVYATGDTLISKITYEYDTQNNLIQQIAYDRSGKETTLEDWAYDTLGRITMYNYSIFDARFGGVPKLRLTKTYAYN